MKSPTPSFEITSPRWSNYHNTRRRSPSPRPLSPEYDADSSCMLVPSPTGRITPALTSSSEISLSAHPDSSRSTHLLTSHPRDYDELERGCNAWNRIQEYHLSIKGLPTLDQVLSGLAHSPLSLRDFDRYLRRRYRADENLHFLEELEKHERMWQAYCEHEHREQAGWSHSPSVVVVVSEENDEDESININNLRNEQLISKNLIFHDHRRLSPEDLMTAATAEERRHIHNIVETREGGSDMPLEAVVIKVHDAPTLNELHDSALRLYERFCSPYDAEKYSVCLPEDQRLALHELVEVRGRVDPAVFSQAKAYVYGALGAYYYPHFLDEACTSNISLPLARILMLLGVLVLTAGFAFELTFVFLNLGGWTTRLWGSLPIFLGWSCLITSLSEFSPLLTLLKLCGTHGLRFYQIKESAVQRLHNRRAVFLFVNTVLATVVTTTIFILVPGHRLVLR
ncbi:uncharacterized protein VTP21DRAFT_10441 [Calcarisporiella thermophila]|uniref:uncharacterized protein n=1 Tax=Calcarisporiella thermophila TaxID=911321 RepID=UPI00374374B3